jgi:uncharacterized protein
MGYRDSPARLGRHDGIFCIDKRPASDFAPGENFAWSPRVDTYMGQDNCNLEPSARQIDGRSAGTWVLLFLVRFYITFLSPFFGGSCKFYPSCSNYAAEAIATHGARRGFVLAMKRLLRCRPFTKGGFDPVPDSDLTRAAGSVPGGVAIAHRDLPMLGCLGKPFAATPGLRDVRAGNKGGAAQ